MTPEERNLIGELFDRLATLEDAARDPEAERAIKDGLRQAPNAAYALVQTVLVQDEALKRADARIRALEAELGIGAEAHHSLRTPADLGTVGHPDDHGVVRDRVRLGHRLTPAYAVALEKRRPRRAAAISIQARTASSKSSNWAVTRQIELSAAP